MTTLQLSRSGANKPSDRKPFAVRVRVGASWYYATPRRERIKLGLAGSVQAAVFSPRRSLAKRFTNRRQALSWARWMASGYPIVEVVGSTTAPSGTAPTSQPPSYTCSIEIPGP